MKRTRTYILFISFLLMPLKIMAQPGCQVPLSPVLRSVSIDPSTGFTEIRWSPSPSPGIAAYIVYTFKDGTGMVLDTIWDAGATSYTYASTASKYFSVSYVVASHRVPDCTSPLSNPVSSIFCSSRIDTCKKELMVEWNSYTDFPAKVLSYSISASVNGAAPTEIVGIPKSSTSYKLEQFETDAQYCFTVKAILEGGGQSVSNKSCLLTKMQRPPQWINADNSVVSAEGRISLTFSVDPASEIKLFRLERRTGYGGAFSQLAQLTSSGSKVLYTDTPASDSDVNFYRLLAINSCGLPATASNVSSNMKLDADIMDAEIKLSWNSYRQWKGIISQQKVYMNNGSGYSEYAAVSTSDSSFSIDYRDIMYSITGSDLCFYIDASEALNPHGINGHSISSVECITPIENVTIPNIFSPNDDLLNDRFRPVLSFTPSQYELTVTDRTGKILFRTKTYAEEWDGRYGGSILPQGVYLWYLDLVTPSGRSISKRGTVTILTDR